MNIWKTLTYLKFLNADENNYHSYKSLSILKKQSQLNADEIQHIKSTYIYCCYDYKLNQCNSSLLQY